MIGVSIIEDEEFTRKLLKKYIKDTSLVKLIREYSTANEAVEDEELNAADILILDIEMPNMNGFDFLELNSFKGQVIISSSHKKYAANAFDCNVADFLSKPVKYERFEKALEKAINLLLLNKNEVSEPDHIFIKNKSGYSRVNLADILYVQAYADYMIIYTTKEKIMALTTMKSFHSKLPKDDFIRVHRSYLVHFNRIDRVEDSTITIGEKSIPVSRSCKDDLINRLNLL